MFASILSFMPKVIFGNSESGSPDNWCFRSEGAVEILSAKKLDEVLPLLTAVEEATASDRWAIVMLSYEAAPAFDRALVTHEPGDSPLAFAAIFSEQKDFIDS